MPHLEDYRFYLASKSPRRHELLKGMGIPFTYYDTNVKEVYPPTLTPPEVAEYLSQLKLSKIDFSKYGPKDIFIACDTIVVLGNKIIGKPKDKADAVQMISELSGQTHTVISGLTLANEKTRLTKHEKTIVKFAKLSITEIEHYVEECLPLDKAGAYGVQEWIGYVGIEGLNGSFYNVMGLPTRLLWTMIEELTEDC